MKFVNFMQQCNENKIYIGDSFTKSQNSTFLTNLYDFIPESFNQADSTLTVDDNSIDISMLNQTTNRGILFKGNINRNVPKECILIYDTIEKKFILEKISCNVKVKCTRKVKQLNNNESIEKSNLSEKNIEKAKESRLLSDSVDLKQVNDCELLEMLGVSDSSDDSFNLSQSSEE
ncbi:hypothetical protein A3Q56_07774 [Intoshia linei]|uniref:Transcription elongation factor Eaf N-terminal domain-containing protein n=1 Tax=Intoshia linei TaxID=1819745 RepID=A0A177ATG8_9BILA|nr:hypothetical protein A3Q56_07774 [Intoshia linei]